MMEEYIAEKKASDKLKRSEYDRQRRGTRKKRRR
jgi:hypothetical protein